MYTLKDIQLYLYEYHGATVIGHIPNGFVFGFNGIPSGAIDLWSEIFYLTSPKLKKSSVSLKSDWESCRQQLTKRIISPTSLDLLYGSLPKMLPWILSVNRGYIPNWVPSFDCEERVNLYKLASSIRNGQSANELPLELIHWHDRIEREVAQNEKSRLDSEKFRKAFKRAILVEEVSYYSCRMPVFLREVEFDFEDRSYTAGEPRLFERIKDIKEFPHITKAMPKRNTIFYEDGSNAREFWNGEVLFLHVQNIGPNLLTSAEAFLFPRDPVHADVA